MLNSAEFEEGIILQGMNDEETKRIESLHQEVIHNIACKAELEKRDFTYFMMQSLHTLGRT